MGISSGAQTPYHLEGLSIADVAAGIRGFYQDRKSQEELSMDVPTIDGDSNNIMKVVGGGASSTKSAAVATYFVRWKETGIKVHPMVDYLSFTNGNGDVKNGTSNIIRWD